VRMIETLLSKMGVAPSRQKEEWWQGCRFGNLGSGVKGVCVVVASAAVSSVKLAPGLKNEKLALGVACESC
jgi:hypothetical protein